MRKICALGALILVAGCAAPSQVIQVQPGVYSLSLGAMGIEGGEAGARNKALTAASNYCAGLGQKLSVQSQDSHGPVEWGSAAGSSTVVFRCVAS